MAYLEENMDAISRLQQHLELEIKKAMREALKAQMRDYDEYTQTMAFNREFRETEISFNQWLDIKYNNLKNIRKWARKQLKDTTCL